MRNLYGLTILLAATALVVGCGKSAAPANSNSNSGTTVVANYVPGDAAKGKTVFAETCAACHGADGKGAAAPNVVKSERVSKLTEEGVYAFFNSTHKPPLTQRPGVTDEKLRDVAAYLLSIQEQ